VVHFASSWRAQLFVLPLWQAVHGSGVLAHGSTQRNGNIVGTSNLFRLLGSISDEPGKAHDTNHYLKDNQRRSSHNEELAPLRLEGIGEDSSDECQQERKRP
jgi:hypothetical protein